MKPQAHWLSFGVRSEDIWAELPRNPNLADQIELEAYADYSVKRYFIFTREKIYVKVTSIIRWAMKEDCIDIQKRWCPVVPVGCQLFQMKRKDRWDKTFFIHQTNSSSVCLWCVQGQWKDSFKFDQWNEEEKRKRRRRSLSIFFLRILSSTLV